MSDVSSPNRTHAEAAFDRVTGVIALMAALAFVATAIALGPCEAMERLAIVLRRVLPFWGR